ncbi:hypothetical protein [Streptomyces sp. NPDC047985]|uniref:hypothetical protein n=1 Tax=Streptomyces sp. NPDC047985 TaxID=3155384 RepID=UPI00344584AC
MATTTTTPSQPAIDDTEARMRVFQIIGSDIYPDAPAAFTGDWHEALRTTAARWAGEPTWTCRICETANSYWTDTCGHCDIFRAPTAA